jgi:hypothetical protein
MEKGPFLLPAFVSSKVAHSDSGFTIAKKGYFLFLCFIFLEFARSDDGSALFFDDTHDEINKLVEVVRRIVLSTQLE